ncbi:MAG: nicotinate-nicotinamide nucleotide adenylyltransferase [Bryobacteraceae bacterium]|nr:nicotinate-nicotinamide nucleotide adenylyltransferase [Bryobacteraceae bacterium]
MELFTPSPQKPARLGILAGTFNPPTRAHIALAEAALARVDHVLLVIPGQLPHKTWEGASLPQRVDMLRQVAGERVSAAVSEGGLYIDMVREARSLYPDADIYVVCGRDAAERIATWDYGEADAFEGMLSEFRMLVAARRGTWQFPAHLAHAVEHLDAGCWDDYSSTAVRDALAAGQAWRELVPASLHEVVEEIYRAHFRR